MDKVIEKIKIEGRVVSENVLKVDSFLNHQIDPNLMTEIGKAFATYFRSKQVTKVLTLESSGIAPALMVALELGTPMIFAKKQKPITMENDFWMVKVFSYTKQEEKEIYVEKPFLKPDDNVLIIDDFLASGAAAFGLTTIIKQAKAKVAGIGIVIEKAFQDGRTKLENAGYDVLSLARIKSLSNQRIDFIDEK